MKKRLATSITARLGMAGALASAMLFAVPALAQDSRLSLADRVAVLEQANQNQDKSGIGMVNQVQQLQAQVQQLQGQIEELQHQQQQAAEQSKAQYVDLDSRLARLEKGGAPAAAPNGNNTPNSSASAATASAAAEAVPPAGNGADNRGNGASPAGASSAAGAANPAAQAAYDTAFNDLRGGDYAKASREFRAFLEQNPNHTLAPNAFYWLGESYYVTMNYPLALEAFQKLLQLYPQSEKSPDALLKVGYTQYELKQVDAAKTTLKSVSVKYPGSKAAGLAQERLRRIQTQSAG
jgi:tol-pal system protein YbgF